MVFIIISSCLKDIRLFMYFGFTINKKKVEFLPFFYLSGSMIQANLG